MMKPSKTFKMDKETKRTLSTLYGQKKYDFKKMMIEAQLCSAVVVREKKKGKDKDAT